jgi:hypothetical protein
MVTPATLVHRNADYGNTWQRAAVVRPCGHRRVCHPSDERFEPTSNLSNITVTAGVLHRTADGSPVDHASAVARRPRVEHRTHQQARWPVARVGSHGRNRAAMNAAGGATPSTE